MKNNRPNWITDWMLTDILNNHLPDVCEWIEKYPPTDTQLSSKSEEALLQHFENNLDDFWSYLEELEADGAINLTDILLWAESREFRALGV